MKIVFHSSNAACFRQGFDDLLDARHSIVDLPDTLVGADAAAFSSADVIVGIRLGAGEPNPAALRLYHAPAAGTDMIEPARLPPGAALCNCFGHEQAIAEYVMAALLLRHVPIPRADPRLRDGHWDYWAGRPGALRSELGAQTIGLLGYGHIGRMVARRAKAFGMRVVVANRTPVQADPIVDESFDLNALHAFAVSADAIVVSLPLTGETRGLVDAAFLAAMRRSAVIVNVGRGPVIEQNALYDALATGAIGGAILDTWYDYPTDAEPVRLPAQRPFHTLANVVMTPHMSGWTSGTVERRQRAIAENINRLERGEALLNRII